MKRGTKITVFVASMALTFGSLMAFIGPRHCGPGMYGHHHGNCDRQEMKAGWQHQGCEQEQPVR